MLSDYVPKTLASITAVPDPNAITRTLYHRLFLYNYCLNLSLMTDPIPQAVLIVHMQLIGGKQYNTIRYDNIIHYYIP